MKLKAPTIGLVEVPTLGLYDPEGHNWTALYRRNTFGKAESKLINYHGGLTKMATAGSVCN
jgi:hypothetical protein